MDQLGDYLLSNVNSYNRCIIHLGGYILKSEDKIFNKKLTKEKYDSLLSKFVQNKYKMHNKIIYRYKNYYYDVNKKKAYKKINNKNYDIKCDNYFVELFKQEDIDESLFSCRREYDSVYNYELIKIELAPELFLNFISESNFYTASIEVVVDHNIDNTRMKLKKLFAMINT